MVTSLVSLQQRNVEKYKKLIKILQKKTFISSEWVEEFQWNFRKDATYGNIVVTKKPGFPLLSENEFLEKPQGGSGRSNLRPIAFLGLKIFSVKQKSLEFSNHGMSESPCYGKSMKKQKYYKVIGFFCNSYKSEIHTISKRWDEWILILHNKYGKAQTVPRFWFAAQI